MKKFSILTQVFKNSEIRTIEDLMDLIRKSPMDPKPDLHHLWSVWDFKSWADDNLSGKKLRNHSFYHGFKINRENGFTKLRAKALPQVMLKNVCVCVGVFYKHELLKSNIFEGLSQQIAGSLSS